MKFPISVAALAFMGFVSGDIVRDRRDENLNQICQQEPDDIGIVLDSSASINVHGHNFVKGLNFLKAVIDNFRIGSGPHQTRVSIIPFGQGIYTDQSFNLDTYNTKAEVLNAIGNTKYMSGQYTDTNLGLKYLYQHLLAPDVTRDYADKIGIVLTDGNSQRQDKTAQAAAQARAAGIEMIAIGVGDVDRDELVNIAGDDGRVFHVGNYSALMGIVDELLKITCKPIPTTPPPPTECGDLYPADINFVFSQTDLGVDNTVWTTDFITRVVRNEDFDKGFRFGVVSGSCPEDAGFHLDKYDTAEEIRQRMTHYEKNRMGALIKRVTRHGFTAAYGGRSNVDDVVVLIVTDENYEGLQGDVAKLLAKGIKVYVVDPSNSGRVTIQGAIHLVGEHPLQASDHFVGAICHREGMD